MNTEREANQILKEILKPVPKNKRHYPYLQREDVEDKSAWYVNRLHKYSFKGHISPEYHISDIYLLFFKSFYNVAAHRQLRNVTNEDTRMRIKQSNISFFYKEFIRVVYLQSLLGQEGKRTDHTVALLADTVKQKESDSELQEITKGLINIYFNQYKNLWQKKANIRQYEQTKKLRQEIQEVLARFYSYVQQKWEQILNNEVLSSKLIAQSQGLNPQTCKNSLITYVCSAFIKISKIYLLSKSKKKYMLENLQNSLGRYMTVKVVQPLPLQAENRTALLFSRLSRETQPVLTKLNNYMLIRRVNNKQTPATLRQSSLTIIQDILAACRRYYRSVKRVYPLITLQDVIIDQKSLKPVLGHTSLIYDALGVQGKDVASAQLQLAMSCTPRAIEFQKCFLETQSDEEWALIRKYFAERRQKKQQQDQQPRRDQIADQDSDEQAELQRLEGCPVKSREIEEKVHTWRLICIFHEIMKEGKHLIIEFYNKRFAKLAKTGTPPFRRELYDAALKQLHHQILQKPTKIKEYLGLQIEENEESLSRNFDLKLQDLQSLLNMQQLDEDSLLQRHRFEKSKSELWVRAVLRKQVFQIILRDKYFKRMLNAKKYMVMFLMCSMEIAYETVYPIWQAERKAGARKLLIGELKDQNQFKKLSFTKEKERERSNLESINKRLNQYLNRSDDQNRYLQSNTLFKKNFKNIYESCLALMKYQKLFIDYQQNVGIEKEQSTKGQYKQSIEKAKAKAVETFDTSSLILKELLQKQFENKLERLEDFHKMDIKLLKEFYRYLTKKFYYLIKAFHMVTSNNFRKYQTFVLPFLLQPKSLGIQTNRKLQEMNQNQLQELNAKLEQIGEILREGKSSRLGESERMELKSAS